MGYHLLLCVFVFTLAYAFNSAVTYHILSEGFILYKTVFPNILCTVWPIYKVAGVYPPLWYHLA